MSDLSFSLKFSTVLFNNCYFSSHNYHQFFTVGEGWSDTPHLGGRNCIRLQREMGSKDKSHKLWLEAWSRSLHAAVAPKV